MARPKAKAKQGEGKERGKLVKADIVKQKCKDCGIEYSANHMKYENGDVVITPPRCPDCQTAHITNLRVNKTIKDLSLLGNLKARLSDVQREAVLQAIATATQTLCDRYSGTTVKVSAFDLKRVKA